MIDSFSGEWRPLSNFWYHPVVFEGETYPTNEHAFQAAKTLDLVDRVCIKMEHSPQGAKAMGRVVKLREDWESIKEDVMTDLQRQKFADPALRRLLLSTFDRVLIEGNTWGDRYWGMCDGSGKNRLGIILMQVRKEIMDTPYDLIIAGSRSIKSYQHVRNGIIASGLWKEYGRRIRVVSGRAKGVDKLGEDYARLNSNFEPLLMPADWDNLEAPGAIIRTNSYGKQYNLNAGYDRNITMGETADGLLAIWDGVSGGTKQMIEWMQAAGKFVYVHRVDGTQPK